MSGVTKKHMEWAAKEIREQYVIAGNPNSTAAPIVMMFAGFFRHFNPNFDTTRFFEAAMGEACAGCQSVHACRCRTKAQKVAKKLAEGSEKK